MTKKEKESVWDGLMALGAIVGGAYLIAELVKLFGKEVTIYQCPNCKSKVNYHQEKCHVCHAELKWKV